MSEELRELLKYTEESVEENAKSENLKEIHEIVKTVKQDKEASREYMRIMESRRELIEEGRELERENTERERQRADKAEAEVVMLQKILHSNGIEIPT